MTDVLKPTRALIVQEVLRVGARQINNPGFKGNNFMTRFVIAYYALRDGRQIELSMGEFLGDTLIGFTVLGDHEQSRCCYTLDELAEALEPVQCPV